MRILMVLEHDFPTDIRVENEIASLVEDGHELHIACYSHNKEINIPGGLNYTIHKRYIPGFVHKSSVGALKFNFYFNFWQSFIKSLFEKHDFDVIHIHDLPLAVIGIEMRKMHKVRFVLDLHENWPALLSISKHTNTFLGNILSSSQQWKEYERKMAGEADAIIVVVDEAKIRIADLGVRREKIHVVSNTLNLKRFNFEMQPKDQDKLSLVYGGGVNYHRGLQIAIKALQVIPEKIPDIRLMIIGTGSYLSDLINLAKRLGVDKYIEFIGWKPQKELLEIMSKADIALIPHIRSEHTDSTVPHKIFQYMYAGIPILASDCLPLKRILGETGTGICFRDQDEESFAENLDQLTANTELLGKIRENGRYWVEKKYNWSYDAKILKGIYQSFEND